MDLIWATTTGRMVGIQAANAAVMTKLAMSESLWLLGKVWRQRVFFLACKRGATEDLLKAPGFACKLVLTGSLFVVAVLTYESESHSHVGFWQGISRMTPERMRMNAKQPWNLPGRLPLTAWLAQEQSSLDKSRLSCIGNVVVPGCCQLALHIIAHHVEHHRLCCKPDNL